MRLTVDNPPATPYTRVHPAKGRPFTPIS